MVVEVGVPLEEQWLLDGFDRYGGDDRSVSIHHRVVNRTGESRCTTYGTSEGVSGLEGG